MLDPALVGDVYESEALGLEQKIRDEPCPQDCNDHGLCQQGKRTDRGYPTKMALPAMRKPFWQDTPEMRIVKATP